MDSENDKQAQLDQIKAEIIEHNVCPDLAKTAKHLVFGEGSPNARIVFIGEAPGRTEDETGKPFVGAAGRFLNELLESVGLQREDVYITSILKYRPPKNRDPRPEEKAEFWPYLQAQLEVIRPKLIVTLGRHSTNCFLPDLQISKEHGQTFTWQSPVSALSTSSVRSTGGPLGQPVALATPPGAKNADTRGRYEYTILPLYHPAAALYNSGMRQTIIDDFAVINKLI